MAERERRCRSYLEQCPDAISGNGGHNATLRAACECLRFALDNEATWRVMRWFNDRKTGDERWSDKELQHKIDSARTKVENSGELGVHLIVPGNETPAMDDRRIAALNTDVGNAARLVRRYGNKIRYCFGTGKWLVWDGRRWKVDDRGEILGLCKETALAIINEAKRLHGDAQQECLKWATKSQKQERLGAMANLAQPDVAVTPSELDADPLAFNCLNGTLDLRTGELRPHDPDDLITKLAPVEYDPDAKCPLFDQFLKTSLNDDTDLIRFVQRWLGHCLTGDVREQFLIIFHGAGSNGKSVLLDTVSAVMGDYAAEAPPDLVTVRKNPEHPTEIANLLGRRMVIASETERGAQLRLQLIKRLTGNERLKARHMRQDYFEFTRTHKLILVTNNKPELGEDTEAVWRRLRMVPFDVIVPMHKRDPQLMRKLRREASGILTWLVHGCLGWLHHGLTEPDAVVLATDQYRGVANSVDAFLEERCSLGQVLNCSSSALHEAYRSWCARNERAPLRGRAFGAALKRHGCETARVGGARRWLGVALNPDPCRN